MMNNVHLALNRELLKVDLIRLQIEILIEQGMSLTSPKIIELNNIIDEHSFRATKIKQGLSKIQKKKLVFKITL
ncbi:MAG: hypothetical protein GX995_09475 [Clostridiales bacterium]|nr:hypothetical protein [Clostridiales bacterium]